MIERTSTTFSGPRCRKRNAASTTPSRRFHLLKSELYQLFILENEAVIRVYDEAGDVIETHEHAGEFKGDFVTRLGKRHARA
jgi:hypothetical protein